MVIIGPTGVGDNPILSGTGGIVQGATGAVKGAASAVTDVSSFVQLLGRGSTWLRILMVLGGVALMLLGLTNILKQTEIGGAAISAVSKGAV